VHLRDALDACEADKDLAGLLGNSFVTSFPTYTRNTIDQFELSVTDWESREDVCQL